MATQPSTLLLFAYALVPREDPIGVTSRAAGGSDGQARWSHHVEPSTVELQQAQIAVSTVTIRTEWSRRRAWRRHRKLPAIGTGCTSRRRFHSRGAPSPDWRRSGSPESIGFAHGLDRVPARKCANVGYVIGAHGPASNPELVRARLLDLRAGTGAIACGACSRPQPAALARRRRPGRRRSRCRSRLECSIP